MKLLAFAASNSSQSINRQLVNYAIGLLEGGQIEGVRADALEISTLDLNDFEMPIYSIDRQNADGIPQQAHDFYDTIGAADALLISFAEHNGSYTVAFKNVFDWASRIEMRVYHDKPIVMLATSPGGGGGGFVLRTASQLAGYFGNEVLASLSIPRFAENFDTDKGAVSNPELDAGLREALATLSGVPSGGSEEPASSCSAPAVVRDDRPAAPTRRGDSAARQAARPQPSTPLTDTGQLPSPVPSVCIEPTD